MLKSIKKAYTGGFRAGRAETPYYRHGGTRGALRVSPPLNPYNNVFARRWRPLLAAAWERGQYDGIMRKMETWL